jgi:hypothetical protein
VPRHPDARHEHISTTRKIYMKMHMQDLFDDF